MLVNTQPLKLNPNLCGIECWNALETPAFKDTMFDGGSHCVSLETPALKDRVDSGSRRVCMDVSHWNDHKKHFSIGSARIHLQYPWGQHRLYTTTCRVLISNVVNTAFLKALLPTSCQANTKINLNFALQLLKKRWTTHLDISCSNCGCFKSVATLSIETWGLHIPDKV